MHVLPSSAPSGYADSTGDGGGSEVVASRRPAGRSGRAPSDHHVLVARTARYHVLGCAHEAEEVWFVLHGYGQLAHRFVRQFARLDDGRRLIVAPEALSRFYLRGVGGAVGATWMTREDREREIADTMGYLNAVFARVMAGVDRERVRVHLLGFAQGAEAAARWTAYGNVAPDRLVLWGGSIPEELPLEVAAPAFRATELVLVAGDGDPFVTPERRAGLEERLDRCRIPYQAITFPGEHVLDGQVLEHLAAPVG